MINIALARLGKNSLIYGIGGAFNRFIGLILLPFFTRALSPEDYGVLALLLLITVLMNGILSLGTGNSMGILYYKEDIISMRPTIIWTNILLLIANGLFWYFVVWISAPTLSMWIFQSSEYYLHIRIVFLTAVLNSLTAPWLAFLRMEDKAKEYLKLTLSGGLINIFLAAFFVLVLEWGLLGMMSAGAICVAIMFVVIWYNVGRKLKFSYDPKFFYLLLELDSLVFSASSLSL